MKSLKAKIAVAIFATIIGINIGSALLFPDANSNASPTRNSAVASSQTQRVVYKIVTSECAEFSVTYEMPGGTAQKNVSACDGMTTVDSFEGKAGDFIYLSIQNENSRASDANFSCNIFVNDVLTTRVWSSGFASIASCDGSIP